MFAILLIAACTHYQTEIDDRADLIEVNHLYDEQGKLILDQVIFWEWRGDESTFRVIAWRLLKTPSQHPEHVTRRGGYCSVWREGNYLRRVWAPSKRTTWTQYDPEVYDRQFLPQHARRGLTGQPPARQTCNSAP